MGLKIALAIIFLIYAILIAYGVWIWWHDLRGIRMYAKKERMRAFSPHVEHGAQKQHDNGDVCKGDDNVSARLVKWWKHSGIACWLEEITDSQGTHFCGYVESGFASFLGVYEVEIVAGERKATAATLRKELALDGILLGDDVPVIKFTTEYGETYAGALERTNAVADKVRAVNAVVIAHAADDQKQCTMACRECCQCCEKNVKEDEK